MAQASRISPRLRMRLTSSLIGFLAIAMVWLTVSPAAAAPGDTTRVSVTVAGAQADGGSSIPAISADGRYVAFGSSATNLVGAGADTNGSQDIFVRDRQTPTTTRVSVSTEGVQGNGHSLRPSISADGQIVAFDSRASTLLANGADGNNRSDVFVHDAIGTTRVSVGTGGVQGNNDSNNPSISGDGRYIAFESRASNLVAPDNAGLDVFVRDRQAGTTTKVSVGIGGALANSTSYDAAISGDGRYVAFASSASNLVAGDSPLQDVFVRDLQNGVTERVSPAGANAASSHPSISADGRFIAYDSQASNLVAGEVDSNGRATDVFLYDRVSRVTSRASVNSTGVLGNGNSEYPSLSADGRFIAFASAASNLVPNDNNGKGSGLQDVFVRDRLAGTTERASVDSAGIEGNSFSNDAAISGDSHSVAFASSASNLLTPSPDTNGAPDIFLHERADACELTVITVNSTADGDDASTPNCFCETATGNGECTLRAAIEEANARPGKNTIVFDILPAGPQTITPLLELPWLGSSDPVIIDGTTQRGFAGRPIIELNGVTAVANSSGFQQVPGLLIRGSNSLVRGLVINRFTPQIQIYPGSDNLIAGNFIGTDITGTAGFSGAAESGVRGVEVFSANNTVGGASAADRNIISGNTVGVEVGGGATKVIGNFVGTDVTGTARVPNGGIGVRTSMPDTIIGGTAPGEGNVISGNGIGPPPQPGGIGYGEGIVVEGSTRAVVQGNLIGTQADGRTPLGNSSYGVFVDERSSGTTIGGSASGAGNTIAFNGREGVIVEDTVYDFEIPTGNAILSNSVFSNTRLGIDLTEGSNGGDGVTANDPGDTDTGANNLQNFPVLTSAVSSSGAIKIGGSLNSTARTSFTPSFTIEYFANTACDNPSGYGEGERFLGRQVVKTDSSGNATLAASFKAVVAPGQYVTATATDPGNNTSEFSQCRPVTAK